MKKTLTLVSAVALSAAFAVSASAQQLPLNNTVSGSAGAVKVDGQTGFGELTLGTGIVAGVTTIVLIAALTDRSDSTTTD